MEALTQITSDQPLYLTLKDNEVLVGPVASSDGKLTVRTGDAGTIAVSRDSIQTVRSKEEEEAYKAQIERMRNPSLKDLWSGTIDTGLALSRGNAETSTFNFGINAARTTTRDKITTYMIAIYSRNSTAGKSLVSANAKRGGARYDINFSPKTFAFGLGNLENDEFQKLDLRLTLGVGLGYHAAKSERTTLDLFGGGTLNHESYSTGLNRSSGELLIGEELTHKLGRRTSLKQRNAFMTKLSETGRYRLNFDITAVSILSAWLDWTVTWSDRYASNPIVGTKANDVLLTTGLRMKFGK
jgi:putative salt-induced outer membrane protein YdiY